MEPAPIPERPRGELSYPGPESPPEHRHRPMTIIATDLRKIRVKLLLQSSGGGRDRAYNSDLKHARAESPTDRSPGKRGEGTGRIDVFACRDNLAVLEFECEVIYLIEALSINKESVRRCLH